MNFLHLFLKYLTYSIAAKSANSIHSPFVFDLYSNLISDDTPFYAFDKIEDLRLILENDNRKIFVTDFGAGFKKVSSQQSPVNKNKRIKTIIRKSATSEKFGQLLFRLVNKFQPQTILEIGTSLGLGTLYLATPNSKARVITLEGCPEISNIAKSNFEKLKVKNIEQVVGNFDETLPWFLFKTEKLDFVFFDGNHRKEPTLRYFEQCLKKSHNETIFIFDDIHWSDGMDKAWSEIKKHPQVAVTIDLFFFGIVFFNKELSRQNFLLKF